MAFQQRMDANQVGEMQVPVYKTPRINPPYVHPWTPGYGGFVEGIKAENRHGGTYGMLRDGEDKVFGELWRKTGPQARTNNFLMGALPRYGGHISADVQWAKKLETLTAPGPQGLGSLSSNSTLDLFQSRKNTSSTMLRLQKLQTPDQQQDAYVSAFDKKVGAELCQASAAVHASTPGLHSKAHE